MDAPEGKRRRRKKTGLRVPSDDVPRRAASEAEPRLALADAVADEPVAATAPVAGAPTVERPAVGLGQLADAGERANTSGDSVDIAFDDEDSEIRTFASEVADVGNVDDGAVIMMTVDDDDDIEDVSGEVELFAERSRTEEEVLDEVAASADAAVAQPIIDDGRKTELMPALSEEDVAALAADVSGVPASGEEPVAAAVAARSATDAAWDDDEERAAAAPDTDAALPAVEVAADDGGEARHADDEIPVAEAPPETEVEPEAEAAADADPTPEVASEAVPVAAQAVGGTVQPGDASDSGELLTEDLIEEFQGGEAVAVQRDDVRAETVLEPVEELAAADVVELDNVPAAASPPPAPKVATPPPPRKKPPPAPPRAALGQAAAPPRRKAKPWFEEIFDEDYLRTLPFLTPRQTQKQAAFVIDAIGADAGASVLDLGCGYGRHAMELAARGYHVVGLDSSLPLLIRGADEAQRRGLTINFVHGDMRELTFENQFDGAYCLFGTFGYFDDETNKKTAQAVARALKPGGRFVVEVLNRDYLIADLPSRVWWEGDGCVVLEEVDFNYFSSRIVSNRSVVFDDGRQLEQEISMRAYSLHEIGKLLHAAGFRIVELSGSMDTKGRFFGNQSREILVVCEKRGPKSTSGDTTPPTPPGDDELGNGKAGTLPGTGGEGR